MAGGDVLRALSAGGYGASLAADTLLKQLRAQAEKRAMDQQDQQQRAKQLQSQIIMNLIGASGQTPQLQPPIPPQPGQPSTPMSNPGRPGMAMPDGGGAPGGMLGGMPGGMPGGGAPPMNPALAVMQGQQPQMPQPDGGGGAAGLPRLTWQTIMQEIKKQAPNISTQDLTATIDQFLPIMDAQSRQDWDQKKFAFQQFKDQQRYELDTKKIDEQVRRDDIREQHDQARDDHAQRMEAITMMRFNSEEMRAAAREKEADRWKEVDAGFRAQAAALDREKFEFDKTKVRTGDLKAQGDLKLVDMSINDIDQLIAQVTKNPNVVGGVGAVTGAIRGLLGQGESLMTGRPSTEDTGRSTFTSKREALAARMRTWLQARASTLGGQGQSMAALLPGLGETSSSGQVLDSLKQLRNELETYKQLNPALDAAAGTPPPGGAAPTASAAPGGGSKLPKGTYKSVDEVVKAIQSGKITKEQGLAYTDENPDLP